MTPQHAAGEAMAREGKGTAAASEAGNSHPSVGRMPRSDLQEVVGIGSVPYGRMERRTPMPLLAV